MPAPGRCFSGEATSAQVRWSTSSRSLTTALDAPVLGFRRPSLFPTPGFMLEWGLKLPNEVAVMTLPNATLFPQAWLPLFIFEPRYRRMLADSLASERMFAIAMQRPDRTREAPFPVAGLGLVRVAVKHKDGTSQLILQGLARVELARAVRYKPYRVHPMRPLETPPCDSVAADALLARMRELLQERFALGLPFPYPFVANFRSAAADLPPRCSSKEVLSYLNALKDPDNAADLVSCAVLPGGAERQAILETIDVETRLRRIIRYLLNEIASRRKGG